MGPPKPSTPVGRPRLQLPAHAPAGRGGRGASRSVHAALSRLALPAVGNRCFGCAHPHALASLVTGRALPPSAGGVAVSGLEMAQDRLGLQWSAEEVRRQAARLARFALFSGSRGWLASCIQMARALH